MILRGSLCEVQVSCTGGLSKGVEVRSKQGYQKPGGMDDNASQRCRYTPTFRVSQSPTSRTLNKVPSHVRC